ncbi:MAG: ABC transporter permease [Acidimicrobiales bacterium]|jgi:peptide/nickel transport system permease protein|nr:ABC transporter permease [Acidimicrobiales bacterium]
MARFIVGRIGAMIGVILVLVLLLLVLQRYTPADPVRAKLGASARPEMVEAERERLGYNDPLPVQYLDYVTGLVTGDLQESLRTRRPVAEDLGEFLPATAELALFSLLLAIGIGGALGIASAARWRGSGVLRVVLVGGSSAPVFLLVLLGLLVFYRQLGWLPATGRTGISDAPEGPTNFLVLDGLLALRFDVVGDAFRHLLLPGLCLAIGPAVAIGRTLRGSIIDTMGTDFVRTARSLGTPERTVMRRHALRNGIGPALSMTGLQVGLMFAGVVVVESIVAWPGIGLYTVQSIPRLDFPAIAGVTLVLGVLYVVVNTIVDIAQTAADPRLRV